MAKRDWEAIGATATLLVYALATLIPIVWLVVTSFKQQVDIFTYPPSLVFKPTLEHYRVVLQESSFLRYVRNSVLVAVISTGLSIALGCMAAYAITRASFRGKNLLMLMILTLRIVPPVALIVPLFMMLRATGLYDTVIGLGLVYLTFNVPVTIWLMKTYFADVPVSVEEAALIDGCSRFETLWRVVLPMAAPGLVATSVINIIFSWNEFPLALMLTGQAAKTAPVSITEWLVERGLLWGELAASGTLIVVPVIVFGLLVQRYLVRGLTMGAVKE
jgi:ABC-type glycerol-3-phosphate transport system permease component